MPACFMTAKFSLCFFPGKVVLNSGSEVGHLWTNRCFLS